MDEHQNNSLEDFITEINEEVEQLFDENELLQDSMEEETNLLDIIAQKVAGLHPNSSVERYDRVCGGVLEPWESGVIRYKVNEEYDDNEDCTWIIELPGATKIEFILEKNGFEGCCDFITITSGYDRVTAVLEIGQNLRLRDTEPRGFIMGSRAMVRFISDASITGIGFRLRFLKRLDFDTTIEPDGSKCGGVIVGQRGYLNYKLGKDYSNNERCVWLLHSPGSESIHLQLIDDGFQICCDYLSVNTIDLETGAVRNDMKLFNARNWTQMIEAPLLVIFFNSNEFLPGKGFSLKFRSSGNQLNVKYKYKLEHITALHGTMEHPSEQTKGESGGRDEQNIFVIASSGVTIPNEFYTVIDWKAQQPNGSFLPHSLVIYEALTENEVGTRIPPIWLEKEQFRMCKESDSPNANTMSTRYNENLVKTFYVEAPAFIIVFKSLFDGHNGAEIRLKFDYSRKQTIVDLSSDGTQTIITGPGARVTFTSDEFSVGIGFRLRYERVTVLPISLFWDGFETLTDYLEVSTIDAETGSINKYARLGKESTLIIEESLVVIVFKSDSLTRGMGFSLVYSSNGTISDPDYEYSLCHISDRSGEIKYPNSVWKGTGSGKKEIFLVTHSVNVGEEDDYQLVMKLNWESGVFKKANGSCEYGQVSIYSAPESSDWSVIERFPNDNVTSYCSDVVTVTEKELSVSKSSMFLVIYKPVVPSMNLLKDGSTFFSLTYKMDICGGVFVGNSGVINYKLNESYGSNEECVWLIEVPLAESIFFELEGGEFDPRWDYIIVSSIKPFIGVESKEIVISPENRMALVEGPVVIVTFSSKYIMTRYGFRLHFRMKKPMSKEPAFVYQLFHQELQTQHEFAYNAKSNQVAIAAFSAGIYLGKRVQVDITAFVPQVNESCYSDTLFIYEANGRSGEAVVLTKAFTAADVDTQKNQTDRHEFPQSCVSLTETRLQACKSNAECTNVSISRSFQTGSSIVAIYNSVNVTHNLNKRGFALTSQIK
ncbi:unnamed protein product [Orchesella dallaii]|uniref:CUB domain-containing protein n=1 Tax=Orchesella dallaii TaxID=48710 RepID=A0ABP1S8J6_9HEXA